MCHPPHIGTEPTNGVTIMQLSVACTLFVLIVVLADAALMLVRRHSNKARDAKFDREMEKIRAVLNES
jgi:hypothetical protein